VSAAEGSVDFMVPTPESAGEAEAQAEHLRDLVASLREENQQLQEALDSRIVIEQAKGVLAERYGMGVDDAFDLLRRSARNHRLRLHALAAAVVASRETPAAIRPPEPAA
jgi:AmiR/NasT family two-component response regulator